MADTPLSKAHGLPNLDFFTHVSKDSGPLPAPSHKRVQKGAEDTPDFRAADAADYSSPAEPARSVADLEGQLGAVRIAFIEAEGREPDTSDSEFWRAWKALVDHAQIEPTRPYSAYGG